MTRSNSRTIVLLLVAVLLLALALRLPFLGHPLSWDEALNAHTADFGARSMTSQTWFQDNFYRHPPAYSGLAILFGRVTGAGRVGVSYAMEVMSVLFALALVFVVFLCGRDWFGQWGGILAAFLIAVMPMARIFDTWAKPESLTVLLGTLYVLFFFRKRYVWAGVFLAMALLSKETAIFMPLAVLLFLLIARPFKELKGYLISAAIGAAGSFWWYAFLSRSRGEFTQFFLGRNQSAIEWHKSWYYYLARLPHDLGWPLLILLVLSVVLLIWRLWGFRRVGLRREGYSIRSMPLFCLVWMLAVYLPLSLSHGKPPWMEYAAAPAFALLASWGALEFVALFRRHRAVAAGAVAAILALALALAIPLGFETYMEKAYGNFQSGMWIDDFASGLNERLPMGGKLLIGRSDESPTMYYYLDTFDPERIVMLPGSGTRDDYDIFVLPADATPEFAAQAVAVVRPDLVLLASGAPGDERVREYFIETLGVQPVKGFQPPGVFDGRELLRALGAP